MRKHGLLWMLMSLMVLGIQAAGEDKMSTGEGDIGDFDVGAGDDQAAQTQTQTQTQTTQLQETIAVPKAQWEDVKKTVEEVQRGKYYDDAIADIKREIPDFDPAPVLGKLKEIHAKDPVLAAQYNTPVGFRLLHKEIQEQAAKNDPVNGGSFKGGSGDFASVMKGAEEGRDGMRRKAIDMAL